jgi:hypothetical protein
VKKTTEEDVAREVKKIAAWSAVIITVCRPKLCKRSGSRISDPGALP